MVNHRLRQMLSKSDQDVVNAIAKGDKLVKSPSAVGTRPRHSRVMKPILQKSWKIRKTQKIAFEARMKKEEEQ